jgi:hypothetical protein
MTAANSMPSQNLKAQILQSERLDGLLQYYYRAA